MEYSPAVARGAVSHMDWSYGDDVVIMVCVVHDCGRNLVLVRHTREDDEPVPLVQPVLCWRCLHRPEGYPSEGMVGPSEFRERCSTTLKMVDLVFPWRWELAVCFTCETCTSSLR